MGKPRWRPRLGVVYLALALVVACDRSSTIVPTASPPPTVSSTVGRASPTPASTPAAPISSPTPVVASQRAAATPTPPPADSGTTPQDAADESSGPPERDLFELARRLGSAPDGPIPRVVTSGPTGYEVGHQDDFTVTDLIDGRNHTVRASLKVVSEHAYWYVDDAAPLLTDDLELAAKAYESNIYPTVKDLFGEVWTPGVDNDPRLTILHTPLRGVVGYYSSRDEYPRQVRPESNQREMIYLDGRQVRPGTPVYLGVLTHELQHAVHWNFDAGEDGWVTEGMSEVAKDLAGYGATFIDVFLANPATQLNHWPHAVGTSGPHYGAATLFFMFLAQHYGGDEGLRSLVRQRSDGIAGVESYLSRYDVTFTQVFGDWVVANYLTATDGPYSYGDRAVRVRDVDAMSRPGERTGVVPQYASRYIDLRLESGDALVEFRGGPVVAQVPTACHSGRSCWWSNRGDSIDSTLTREFDLSDLDEATLEFWTWFSVEDTWDYAYVEASADGGATWTILEGAHTISRDPVGNSYGHGYTGTSREWLRESIDLSPYAGGELLLRFEYITDDAVHLDGFLIDDVAIPQLDYFDDAETDGGWQARGFVRTDNELEQEYLVQVVEQGADGDAVVRRMEVGEDGTGSILLEGFGERLLNAVVVISPVTRGTNQPASYTLKVSPAGTDE